MPTSSRICLFSQRNLLRQFYRCANYEFEDIICATDAVDVIAPTPSRTNTGARRWRNRLAYRLPRIPFDPGIEPVRIEGSYDLFLTTCEFISDLETFDVVSDWKKQSRVSACYLTEFWVSAIPKYRRLLRTLAEFDHIFVNCAATAEPLSAALGRPCHFLLPGVDAIRFCPGPTPPARVIDVYSMGRRAPAMHQELLRLRQRDGLFYLHDSYDPHDKQEWCTSDHREHRMLCADLIQRSQYFVVNPAKMDCTAETAGQQEIGYRFFEGAAGGSVMIGRPVDSDLFRRGFNWPDAVVSIPSDGSDIAGFLADLNRQSERLEAARCNNLRGTLLRHDWVYRWEAMLQALGIKAHPKLEQRKQRLATLAESKRPVLLDRTAAA